MKLREEGGGLLKPSEYHHTGERGVNQIIIKFLYLAKNINLQFIAPFTVYMGRGGWLKSHMGGY